MSRLTRLTTASLGALLLVAVALAMTGRGAAALGTVGGFLGCLALVLPHREAMDRLPARLRRLPRWCDAPPIIATLISTPGYGLGWFYGDNLYDEAVHLINGGLAGLVFAAMLATDGRRRGAAALVRAGAAFGLALGAGWEVFEWVTGLIGDWTDTWTDIALTAVGALATTVASGRGLRPSGRRAPHAA